MKLIEAIKIAQDQHYEQKDKGGQPFLGHPLRVMAEMNTEDEMVVAVLHDVFEERLERGGETPSGLVHRGELTPAQGNALDALTRIPKEPYFTYIARVRKDSLATKVKLADLRDNLDERRQTALVASMGERYRQAVAMLTWDLD